MRSVSASLHAVLLSLSAWWLDDLTKRKRITIAVIISFLLGHLVFAISANYAHQFLMNVHGKCVTLIIFSIIGTSLCLLASWALTVIMRYQLELRDQSSRDPLTGLYNRRNMRARIQNLVDKMRDEDGYIGAFFLDLDHLKELNDRNGHKAGDAALKKTGETILSTIRQDSDMAFRFGGDEFVVASSAKSAKEIEVAAERLRERLSRMVIWHNGREIEFSCSLGSSILHATQKHVVSEVIRQADEKLYEVKRSR